MLKKKQKIERPSKYNFVQDEFSNSELLEFFTDKAFPLDYEISEFILTQNIDGFTLNNFLTFKQLKDEFKLKVGNAATLMKFQKRTVEQNDLRSEFEQNFSSDLSPVEIRAKKIIPAKEQLISKSNLLKSKREEKVGSGKLDIVCKDYKNKKVVYTVKLPGQSAYDTCTLAELSKYKDQIITWDRSHSEYGVIYPQESIY